MLLRKIYYWILILILFGLADINGQELLYDEANVPSIKSRAVKADLGGDINASPRQRSFLMHRAQKHRMAPFHTNGPSHLI